jgi:cysteine desulfurase / selenocysteine lyase
MALDIDKIRHDFPILRQRINGHELVYFDNAATTQKPQVMLDELVRYYSTLNSNIHRGVHTLSQRATAAYEETRHVIARIYGCKEEEVIFTKNDTESLNLLSYSLESTLDLIDKNIVITDAEHHSNIVPWQLLCERQRKIQNKVDLRYTKFDENGFIDLQDLKTKIDRKTAILSFTWASNMFGVINDASSIISAAKEINPDIKIIIDAAQFVPHSTFNFAKLDIDFITFSAHKLCGPTGVGVLIGKEDLLKEMPPFLGGGDMIRDVGKEVTTFADLPYRFEAGTPNIADVVAFKSSLEYLDSIGFENIYEYEQELASYLLQELQKLGFIEIYGPQFSLEQEAGSGNLVEFQSIVPHFSSKFALVSFNVKGVHAHDVGTILDEDGIAVRTGHHCTQLIMKELHIPASVRASLYIYNTKAEIDIMIQSLKKVQSIFN